MSGKFVRLSPEVWGVIQKEAKVFETPDQVFRRLLGVANTPGPKGGFRKGKQPEIINAALPGTVAELAAKTGLPEARVRSHCEFWEVDGFYVQEANGRYRRAK